MNKLNVLASDAPLDLSDPKVAEMVTAANVDSKPTSASDPAKAVSKLPGKGTPFTMTLSTEQVAGLIRQAGASNISWKDYLKEQIQEHILNGKVGKAVISQPSTMKDKVSGVRGGIVKRG